MQFIYDLSLVIEGDVANIQVSKCQLWWNTSQPKCIGLHLQ